MKETKQFPILATILVGIATLISGGACLSYEVIWARMLVVPLGNSTDATALVLCAFMLGMALGARAIGNIADRLKNPLRLYVLVEGLLGIYALIVPFIVPALESPALASPVRFGLGLILAAFPAVFMGASIPVLVRGMSRISSQVNTRVGLFYGLNTLGGAIGAALTGLFAIAVFGLTSTSFIAAGASIFAATVVFTVGRVFKNLDPAKPIVSSHAVLGSKASGKTIWAALITAGAGGFTMLSAEVLWARILTFVFGHDTYAFAILLIVVLFGLGLGGLLFKYLAKFRPPVVAVVALGALAVSTLVSFWTAAWLVTEFGRDPFGIGDHPGLATSFFVEMAREAAFAPLLVLLPAISAGVSLPAACALYEGPPVNAGQRIGTTLLVNGVFSALGALIASFFLVPLLGIQNGFVVVALVAAGGAILTALLYPADPKKAHWIMAASVFASTMALIVLMPSHLPKSMLHQAVGKKHQTILHYEEGRTGTVTVTKNKINGERQLFMNAVNEVTTRLVHDQSFKLLGHLGPLLHPHPETGLMICFGAGISAGAAMVHPLLNLDIVELSDTIPGAAGYFEDVNNKVLQDKRLALHIDDGRHFLLKNQTQFDVVMVDSTHPKAVDSWILYTVEFYQLIKQRLDADGVFVQWLPLHGLSEKEFKIIVRSFLEAFPNMTLWANVGFETYGQVAYAKLVGTHDPLVIDYKELAARLREPRIHQDLAPYGMAEPAEILDSFLAGPGAIRNWTAKVPIQTDDKPFLPYITEHSEGRRMSPALLLPVRSPVGAHLANMGKDEPAILKELAKASEATGFLLASKLERAIETWPAGKKIKLFQQKQQQAKDYYVQLAKLHSDDAAKLFEVASYLGNLGYTQKAYQLYTQSLKMAPDNSRTLVNLALIELDLGKTDEAIKRLTGVTESEPNNPLGFYNLAIALLETQDAAAAIGHLQTAVDLDPKLYGAQITLAEAYRQMGKLKKAERLLRTLVDEANWLAEAWDMLGLIAAAQKKVDIAKQYYTRSLSLDPYRSKTHYNLGLVLQQEGRLTEAAGAYSAALLIEPNDAEAHNNLGLVYGNAGLYQKAIQSHQQALALEPQYPEAAYNLGLAYKAAGKINLAVESFAIAQTLAPNLTQIKEQLTQLGIDNAKIQLNPVDGGTTTADSGMEQAGDAGVADPSGN